MKNAMQHQEMVVQDVQQLASQIHLLLLIIQPGDMVYVTAMVFLSNILEMVTNAKPQISGLIKETHGKLKEQTSTIQFVSMVTLVLYGNTIKKFIVGKVDTLFQLVPMILLSQDTILSTQSISDSGVHFQAVNSISHLSIKVTILELYKKNNQLNTLPAFCIQMILPMPEKNLDLSNNISWLLLQLMMLLEDS